VSFWLQTPRAAYVHVPFCLHRCGYCDFTLIAGRDDLIAGYLDALRREIDLIEGVPHEVDTLFLGGGTPSHLPSRDLAQLFAMLRDAFPLAAGAEVSLEANPSGFSREKAAAMAEAGVNRISLGVQSFESAVLKTLERDHSPDDITSAVELARTITPNVGIDLIFGVPGQTEKTWEATLAAAIELQPAHVSNYGLTFEKGTSFWNRREAGTLVSVDDELERRMYQTAIERLTSAGWGHYEISNFARPGFECRHNMVYWRALPYFGVGPGAASYVGGIRRTNNRSVVGWMRSALSGEPAITEEDTLDPLTRAREAVMLGLRMTAGIDVTEFRRSFGHDPVTLGGDAARRFLDQGLIEVSDGRLRLTRDGLFLADTVMAEFL
jgi:oxygen-independent coproporphyrinogen-3 oxidase